MKQDNPHNDPLQNKISEIHRKHQPDQLRLNATLE